MVDDEDPAADPPLDPAVPVEGAQTRPRRDLKSHDALGAWDFEGLKRQFVEVIASGFLYRGTLVGADERELYLRGITRWWVIPLDRVSEVRRSQDRGLDDRPMRRKGPIPGDPDPSFEGPPVVEGDLEEEGEPPEEKPDESP